MKAVVIDSSWQGNTGIGRVYDAYVSRLPSFLSMDFLHLGCKKKNPLYPILLGSAVRRKKHSIFWSPGFFPPVGHKMPAVIMVHDLTHLHYYSGLHRVYYNTVLKPLYKNMDAIVTVSEYTRHELLNWASLEPDKVVMIHNGVGSEFTPTGKKVDLGWPFLFYPGNRRAYKNLSRLIAAYARSKAHKSGVRLVLTGLPDEWITQTAITNNVGDMVVCIGNISGDELPAYYRTAMAVVFVSLYEGFGLPVLEGMASGVPVLTSNVSSLPEVAGDAALMVNPFEIEEISHGIDSTIFDTHLREHLVQKGASRIASFSWDNSAARLWHTVANCAGQAA
ncbi:MAG: glycosyltransferase family 1 protein [Desulfuromonadales bacterium]